MHGEMKSLAAVTKSTRWSCSSLKVMFMIRATDHVRVARAGIRPVFRHWESVRCERVVSRVSKVTLHRFMPAHWTTGLTSDESGVYYRARASLFGHEGACHTDACASKTLALHARDAMHPHLNATQLHKSSLSRILHYYYRRRCHCYPSTSSCLSSRIYQLPLLILHIYRIQHSYSRCLR